MAKEATFSSFSLGVLGTFVVQRLNALGVALVENYHKKQKQNHSYPQSELRPLLLFPPSSMLYFSRLLSLISLAATVSGSFNFGLPSQHQY